MSRQDEKRRLPVVLTIAGSDSGGGAGIQADLRTFHALGVYGCSAVTAVTAQNPREVRRVDVLPAEAVRAQLESVLDVMPVGAAKSGMLAAAPIIETVAAVVRERCLPLVLDPVMVATSGACLLPRDAVDAMTEHLLPLARWITPNVPEAELLCGRRVTGSREMGEAALELHRRYGCGVILKGGHLLGEERASDVVCIGGELFSLSSPLVPEAASASHGTGCTLSAALAARLAQGRCWQDAVISAKAFVYSSLKERVCLSDSLCQMFPPDEMDSAAVELTEASW